MQMAVRFLPRAERDRVFGRFQLNNHAGKTLRERVVDVPSHSIAFFEHCRPLPLVGKVIELKRKHHWMGQCLGQFNFLRAIWRSIAMANTDKASDVSTDQKRHSEKPLSADSF